MFGGYYFVFDSSDAVSCDIMVSVYFDRVNSSHESEHRCLQIDAEGAVSWFSQLMGLDSESLNILDTF